ncbi:MAG: putative bifunctional diguanylate cyclase/phosphodiesterase [Gammaproteobacteria bacterium]
MSLDTRLDKQNEGETLDSSEFRGLMDQLVEGVLVLDEGGVALFANPAAAVLLNRPVDGIVGHGVGLPISGEGDQEVELEVPGVETRSVLMGVSRIEWQGRPANLVSLWDISEIKASQDRLRQAAAVFESTLEGVIITDALNRIQNVNRAFTRISGYSEAEVLGCTPAMFRADPGNEDFDSIRVSVDETGRWQGEVAYRRKSGEVFPAWMSISAVRDEEGDLLYLVGVLSDITEVKESEERLRHMAHFDSLTDLPNRVLFHSRLDHAIDRARRGRNRVAVIYLDLDDFKMVNDSLGHGAGDELLRAMGSRMVNALRVDDTVARLSGDEFAVVIEGVADVAGVLTVASKVHGILNEPVTLSSGQVARVGASLGIAFYPDDGEGSVELMRNADVAMYRAKEPGREKIQVYTPDLTKDAMGRLRLRTRLKDAIDHDGLRVVFQPQYRLEDGALAGLETLARWKDGEFGEISPGRFIPIAEETGLIDELGDHVIELAFAQLARWQTLGLRVPRLAINVSARSIVLSDFPETLMAHMAAHGVEPEAVELEITESALMADPEAAGKNLEWLAERGFAIAIDDFGTGYSSLGYLQRFSVHRLKIDQSFVRGLPDDHNAAAICRTVIALAREFEVDVIAEGVELGAQADFLRQAGCDEVQGFLFARPLEVAACTRLLEEVRSGGEA